MNMVGVRPQDRSALTHLRAHGLSRGYHVPALHRPSDHRYHAHGNLNCGCYESPQPHTMNNYSLLLSPPLEPPRSPLKPPRKFPWKPPRCPRPRPRSPLEPRSPRCRPRPPRACVKPSSSADKLLSTGDSVASVGPASGMSCGVLAGDAVWDVPNLA